MQAFRVVERHPPAHFHPRVVGAEIRVPADFFRLERPVHAFDLPVALRMERGCRGLLQLKFRNEVQEVPRRELPPVIVDDAGVGVGVEFLRTGQNLWESWSITMFWTANEDASDATKAKQVHIDYLDIYDSDVQGKDARLSIRCVKN